MDWNEDNIEEFIRNNKDKFDSYVPKDLHTEHFLIKLGVRFKIIVSIIPHLVKVAIVTLVVFVSSFFIWNGYIRSDKDQMSLSQVSWSHRKLETAYKAELLVLTKQAKQKADADLLKRINGIDTVYVKLKKELKQHPEDTQIIASMVEYYQTKITALKELNQTE